MTAPSDDKPDTPFHAGEIEVQERLGVREIARDREPFIRDRLTEQHRAFFPQLSFLPVGVAGADRRPIATILEGAPGFISCRDPGRVRIEARISPDDPAASHLTPGASLGALGIELETRRRNRFFGEIVSRDASGLDVAIVRAFGNCPKYIRTRSLLRRSAPSHREAEPSRILSALDQGAIELIRRADCFFVASSGGEDGGGRRGADVVVVLVAVGAGDGVTVAAGGAGVLDVLAGADGAGVAAAGGVAGAAGAALATLVGWAAGCCVDAVGVDGADD